MKLLSNRTLKIFSSLIIGLIASLLAYSRPWYPTFKLDMAQDLGVKVMVSFENAKGEILNKTFTARSDHPTLTLHSVHVTDITFDPPRPQLERKILASKEESKRDEPTVYFSCLMFGLTIFLVTWLILENLSWPLRVTKGMFIHFFLHALLMVGIFWTTFPGLYIWDSFDNLQHAFEYSASAFTGFYYISQLMVFLQFQPEAWTLTAVNLFIIFTSLSYYASLSHKLKTSKFYYLGMLIFFSYPINFLISASNVRDIISFWIFNTTLILLYATVLTKDDRFKTKLAIGILSFFSCLLRPESYLILLPGIVLIHWFFHRALFRFFLILAPVIFFSTSTINQIEITQGSKNIYRSTLLISPISYILKSKYPDQLPADVDFKLGPYFKNDYLVKFQKDRDIDPFHQGGVNYQFAESAFPQFKNASMGIIFENPQLFLENRLKISSYMLGYSNDAFIALADDYKRFTSSQTHDLGPLISSLPLTLQERSELASRSTVSLFNLIYSLHHWLASYTIPLYIFLFLLVLRPNLPIFTSFFMLLLARTLLVCLTAPAGYFKYLYPLWLFAPFCLFLFMAERRASLTKEA